MGKTDLRDIESLCTTILDRVPSVFGLVSAFLLFCVKAVVGDVGLVHIFGCDSGRSEQVAVRQRHKK